MRIEYKLGFGDLAQFNLVHLFLSPVMNGTFLAVAAMIFWGERSSNASLKDALTLAIAAYVAAWIVQAILLWLFYFSRRPDANLTNHVIEIRDGGLFESTPFNESLFYWPSIRKVVVRPGFVAIYIAEHQAQEGSLSLRP
jgi:hypothetical protein